MTPSAAELTRRVLLGLEVCVVILATLHSAHAMLTASRLQTLQCAVSGDCEEQPDDATSLVTSGLALAILSSVVLLARLAMLQLRYFPRFVGLLYDTLMACLWALGLAQQLVRPLATARNLSAGGLVVGDTDGVVLTCWRVRGAAVAATATAFYAGRLLFELIFIWNGRAPPNDYRPIQQDDNERWAMEKDSVEAAALYPLQAYSPVLAFFPDD
ncbi:hypothetical protein BBO_06079 [Beauveria brongniartii RCEF 3172]|uniref:MARVEL-like domain protein n=1 Tax=Beauveria brongniartii RCEF 3172 TaxID=1081107 RepID=A0A167BWF1_9HYPO|nr:hypothetical protein BBO_06079 [Beauveria brongniartii RCEF 3172]